jgi:hypothetical protein
VTRIFDAAEEVQSRLQQWGWRFCFIGALAVQRWGEPRFTQDIDLTLLTGFGDEEKFIERLLGSFPPRRADAQAMALSSRVLLLKTSNDVPVDIALGAVPFEVRSIERSSPWKEERELVTCCAETSPSTKHLRDVIATGQTWRELWCGNTRNWTSCLSAERSNHYWN